MYPNRPAGWSPSDEAEAQEELRNPRGPPSGYVDPRRNPEWREAQMDKAMQEVSKALSPTNLPNHPGTPLRASQLPSPLPQQVNPGSYTPPVFIYESNSSSHSKVALPRERISAPQFPGYGDPHDQEMATYQLDIDIMDMRSPEYSIQDEWAKSQLRKIGNLCPRGCRWIRVKGGYRCDGGHHWVTDQMVSKGTGEVIWFMPSGRDARAVPNGFPNQPADYIPPGCDKLRPIFPPGHRSLVKRHGDGGRIKH